MTYSNEDLAGLIQLVSRLSLKDERFKDSLFKECFSGDAKIASTVQLGYSEAKLDWVLEYLGINVQPSELLKFEFLKDSYPSLYQQLFFDQIHMLRARYGIRQKNGLPNFKLFCSTAHLQIEGLLDYYFKQLAKKDENFLNSLLLWTTEIQLQKDDSSYYKNSMSNETERLIYFSKLTENSNLKHKTKYRNQAETKIKPLSGFGRMRTLFANLHQFDYGHWQTKQAFHFEISRNIYMVRNFNFHRSAKKSDSEMQAEQQKREDFLAQENFFEVYSCLQEVAFIVGNS